MTAPMILGPWMQRGGILERQECGCAGALFARGHVIVWTPREFETISCEIDRAREVADAWLTERGVLLRETRE